MTSRKQPAAKAAALPPQVADALHALIRAELDSIGAIDTSIPNEREPGYVVLLRTTKLGKQANVQQMRAMLRMSGLEQEAPSGTAAETLLKLKSNVAVRIGTTRVLRLMHASELQIERRYDQLLDAADGLFAQAVQKCWSRARVHLVVLTAHLALRTARGVAAVPFELGQPLSRYFAHGEPRVCFRCLFDRAGDFPPLERRDPHIYICSRCHEEVLADMPPDLLESASDERERHSRTIERALGRPSKLKAERKVLHELSGLAPDLPEPPLERKVAVDVARSPRRSSAAARYARTEVDRESLSEDERKYVDQLFDFRSVRENW